ncbi:MAG: hypothetical protein R3F33_03240 [Planctomycetota bacterium]
MKKPVVVLAVGLALIGTIFWLSRDSRPDSIGDGMIPDDGSWRSEETVGEGSLMGGKEDGHPRTPPVAQVDSESPALEEGSAGDSFKSVDRRRRELLVQSGDLNRKARDAWLASPDPWSQWLGLDELDDRGEDPETIYLFHRRVYEDGSKVPGVFVVDAAENPELYRIRAEVRALQAMPAWKQAAEARVQKAVDDVTSQQPGLQVRVEWGPYREQADIWVAGMEYAAQSLSFCSVQAMSFSSESLRRFLLTE